MGAGAVYVPCLLYWAEYGFIRPLVFNLFLPFAVAGEAVERLGLPWQVPIVICAIVYHALVMWAARRNVGVWTAIVVVGVLTSLLSVIAVGLFI